MWNVADINEAECLQDAAENQEPSEENNNSDR
jgi:hypothetical protein